MGGEGSGRKIDIVKQMIEQRTPIGVTSNGTGLFLPNYSGLQDFTKKEETVMTITNDGVKTTLLGTAGNYVRIGDATTASLGTTNSEDDLFVSGQIETPGIISAYGIYGQSSGSGTPNIVVNVGGATQGYLSAKLDCGLYIVPRNEDGRANNNVIIIDHRNVTKDHDHPTASTNPTLFIHSSLDPDTANTSWISFTHDTTNAVISAGSGSLVLSSAVGDIQMNDATTLTPTITASGSLFISGGALWYKGFTGTYTRLALT